jgi:hypothetical protein
MLADVFGIVVGAAVGIAVVVAIAAALPEASSEPAGADNGDGRKGPDEERLMTWIGDEEVRLLVHIEPLDDDDTPAPGPRGLSE